VSANFRNVGSHAFLVLAHKDPELVEILIEELKPIGNIYLHIDRKPLSDFSKLLSRNDVFATSEVNVKWGHWSMVEATLILVKKALTDGALRLTLISGDSLPIAPSKEFHSLLESNTDICHHRSLSKSTDFKRDDQYYRRYFGAKNFDAFLPRLMNLFFRKWPIRIRIKKYLEEIELQIGSAYWSVTSETMQKVLDFHERNSQYSSYFKKVKSCDETFFQTLIIFFSKQVNGTGIMYANWDTPNSPHPSPLTVELLEQEFSRQRFYFARKFASENDKLIACWESLTNNENKLN